MKYSILTYQVIAIISFFFLLGVQIFLVVNTYKLNNEKYFFREKTSLKEYYSGRITNDKLFPGGQYIIDTILNRNIPKLEYLYVNQKDSFRTFNQKVCDSIFFTLRKNETITTLLYAYKQQHQIQDSLDYALTIDNLELMIGNGKYISLYRTGIQYPLIPSDFQTPQGIIIGGNLSDRNMRNRITTLTVSIPVTGTYKIIFSLYVDTHRRPMMLVKQMLPVLILTLISLFVMIWLFYVTFKNWVKQKMLAEMKTDFINSITHEFNTPIAAITVANRSLQNEKIIEQKDKIQALTGVIQRQTRRLQKIVGQVLDLTTLHELSLNRESFFINDLLDEVLLDYRLKLSGKEVQLNLCKEATRDSAFLDRFHFTTMLLNILDNGIKYNKSSNKEITVVTHNTKKGIRISIEDNGIGMSAEIKEKIFTKFYRNEEQASGQTTGLGLGLYYVRQIADAHGWDLTVNSKPGGGTTFIITIPN